MNLNNFVRHNSHLILTSIIYFTIGVVLIHFYYQYAVGGDGISYISIAQKYVAGDFSNAINGYWSPLYSWLLTPFLFFEKTPLSIIYSAQILSLIIGFFTIIGIWKLLQKFDIDKNIKTPVLFFLIPILLYFSLTLTTPDLLTTCIVIFYLGAIFNPSYENKLYYGFICGILGALAYLSKSYVFPFFLVHFIFFNVFYYFKDMTKKKKKNILKNLFLGLTIFFVISSFWVSLISYKYGELTFSTSGTYNQEFVGPESQGHPVLYQGLIKPPNNSAISAWEDPSYFKMKSWSPFASWYNFKYQINLIWQNILVIIKCLNYFSILSLLIILASILLLLRPPNSIKKNQLFYLLGTVFIYCAGYSFVTVVERYLWPIYVLIIVLGAFILSIMFKNISLKNYLKVLLTISLCLSFIVLPIGELVNNANPRYDTYHSGKDIYVLAQELKDNYQITGNLASNTNWVYFLYMAYFLNSQYYGTTINNNNSKDLQAELENNNIDYYFVYGNVSNIQLTDYKEITNGKLEGLKIYKINNKGTI